MLADGQNLTRRTVCGKLGVVVNDATVDVPNGAPDRDLRAYVAKPDVGAGPWPGVVVIHELTGLNDDIRRHIDRLASAGYLAAAPNLYSSGGALRCLRATFRSLKRGHGPAVDDILATRAWLADSSECTGRVGVIGFCIGGGFALLLGSRGFAASAPNYAPVPPDPESALEGVCPVVASYGAKERMFRDAPATLTRALTSLGVEHDVRIYPDVGHSFLNRHRVGPLGPLIKVAGFGYDESAAEHAWTRIMRFFDQHVNQ